MKYRVTLISENEIASAPSALSAAPPAGGVGAPETAAARGMRGMRDCGGGSGVSSLTNVICCTWPPSAR